MEAGSFQAHFISSHRLKSGKSFCTCHVRPRAGEACLCGPGRRRVCQGAGRGGCACEWLFHVGSCGRQEGIAQQFALSQGSVCSEAGRGAPVAPTPPPSARKAPPPTSSNLKKREGGKGGLGEEKEMLTHAPERPRNSVYSPVIFRPFVVAKTCFYCIVETSSKSGNLRGIPIKTFVELQRREPQIQIRSQHLAAEAERVEETTCPCPRAPLGRAHPAEGSLGTPWGRREPPANLGPTTTWTCPLASWSLSVLVCKVGRGSRPSVRLT